MQHSTPLSWLRMHPSALRSALIRMVQAAEDRHRAYWSRSTHLFPGWRLGCCLAEALVRPRPVEVGNVLAEHTGEVALAEDEQVVQALTSHAAQEPFAGSIRS